MRGWKDSPATSLGLLALTVVLGTRSQGAASAPATAIPRPELTAASGQLAVTWSAGPEAPGYDVVYSTAPDPATAAVGCAGAGDGCVLDGLQDGVAYHVWLRAPGAGGREPGQHGPPASGTPHADAAPPEAPAAPTVLADDGCLFVRWRPVDGAYGYAIWIAEGADRASARQVPFVYAVTGATEQLVPGLANGRTYHLWVTAFNALGASGFSASAMGTPTLRPLAIQAVAAPPAAAAGSGYHLDFDALGGRPPYTWSVSGGLLPPGLTMRALPPTGCSLAGTPALAGSVRLTLHVRDAAGSTASRDLRIVVRDRPARLLGEALRGAGRAHAPPPAAGSPGIATRPPPPSLATRRLPAGRVGEPYQAVIAVSGGRGPLKLSATGLAPGLDLYPAGRHRAVILGWPAAAERATVLVEARDAAGQVVTGGYALRITDPDGSVVARLGR